MNWRKDLAKLIKNQRKHKCLRQTEVACLAGINYRHYQEIESGRVNFGIDNLFKISEALKVEVHDIIPRKDAPTPLINDPLKEEEIDIKNQTTEMRVQIFGRKRSAE